LPVEQFEGEYVIMFAPDNKKQVAIWNGPEEKAVKAIQKHSMEIYGVQENKPNRQCLSCCWGKEVGITKKRFFGGTLMPQLIVAGTMI